MKIKLLVAPPLARIHGLHRDRILDVIRQDRINSDMRRNSNNRRTWVMGDAGEECALLDHEWEPVEESEETS